MTPGKPTPQEERMRTKFASKRRSIQQKTASRLSFSNFAKIWNDNESVLNFIETESYLIACLKLAFFKVSKFKSYI